jgi:hypothetical protein
VAVEVDAINAEPQPHSAKHREAINGQRSSKATRQVAGRRMVALRDTGNSRSVVSAAGQAVCPQPGNYRNRASLLRNH